VKDLAKHFLGYTMLNVALKDALVSQVCLFAKLVKDLAKQIMQKELQSPAALPFGFIRALSSQA